MIKEYAMVVLWAKEFMGVARGTFGVRRRLLKLILGSRGDWALNNLYCALVDAEVYTSYKNPYFGRALEGWYDVDPDEDWYLPW